MKFFIDTANLKEIEEGAKMGILDGCTTNPSLMAKEGIKGESNIKDHYKSICELVDGSVSAEVFSTSFDGIVSEGEELANIHSNIVVKVPMIEEGIKAIAHFTKNNIKTNCTLVFSATQALLAAKAGATYISPFIGRLDDISTDGLQLLDDIVTIFSNYGFESEVLGASVRHPMHLMECAQMGVDVVTCPFSVYKSLFKHPLTDIGLAKFLKDAEKMQG